jgi:basic membrane protein A and related proteins
VDPAIEVNVVWVNSWFDPASEQEAAKALLAQGADVIFSNAQDTPSVIAVAEEAGAYVFNLNSSMKSYAPTKYLGVVGTDWSPFFKASAAAHLAGTFTGASAWLGMSDDVVYLPTGTPISPPISWRRSPKCRRASWRGTSAPLPGPITNQAGEEAVAPGVVLGDDAILSMDWHVKGVTTPLPS